MDERLGQTYHRSFWHPVSLQLSFYSVSCTLPVILHWHTACHRPATSHLQVVVMIAPSSGLWVVLGVQSSPGPAYIHHVYKRPAAAAAIGGAASWSKRSRGCVARSMSRARVVTTCWESFGKNVVAPGKRELSQRQLIAIRRTVPGMTECVDLASLACGSNTVGFKSKWAIGIRDT